MAAMSRREFGSLMAAGVFLRPTSATDDRSRVALVKGVDRRAAFDAALNQLGRPDFAGRDIYLKANYGNAGPYPATTHPDALTAVVELLRGCGCGPLTLVECCGMGSTRDVWTMLGVDTLARRLDVTLLALEDLAAADQWRLVELPESHWSKAVAVPRFLDREALVVQICNAKTHRFGGIFSASLKNSVGLIARRNPGSEPYNFMQELHVSPYQCAMIAEINQIYAPALVVLDAAQVMVSGGPETGDVADAGLFAMSQDRVALDAVAVALLRIHGADEPIRRTDIFAHEQIKKAAELKLGAASADQVELVASDSESRNAALQIRAVMSGITEDK